MNRGHTVMKVPVFWRFVAALALLSLSATLAIGLVIVLTSPILILLTGTAFLFVCYGIWLIFTGIGQRLRIGWTIAIIASSALCIELYILLIDREDLKLFLVFGLLTLIYLGLLSGLRAKYWHAKRQAANRARHMKFSRPVLIMNPKSGDGRALKAGIDRKAQAMGIEVIITKKGDNIESLARAAARDGADVLGISGGDGTLGAVAKVAIEANLPLVVLPGGTRCHFARDIGMDPKRITDALESYYGVERRVDVGEINGRVFLNNASFGLYADIVNNPDYRDNKLATIRTTLIELLNGEKQAYELQFTDDQRIKHKHAIQILVGINPYETLRLLELGHRQQLDTGQLQVTAIPQLDDRMVRRLMNTLTFQKFFSRSMPDNFIQWSSKYFSVDSTQKTLVVGVDGEREKYAAPVKIKMRPEALRLYVPAEGVRSRQRSPFNLALILDLWRVAIGKTTP